MWGGGVRHLLGLVTSPVVDHHAGHVVVEHRALHLTKQLQEKQHDSTYDNKDKKDNNNNKHNKHTKDNKDNKDNK